MSRTASAYSSSLARSPGPTTCPSPRSSSFTRSSDAPVAPHPRQPRRRVSAAAGAEQPLEHRARVVLDRQRGGRRPPRDGVGIGIGAARTAVAVPDHRVRLDAQLERRQLGFLLQLAGRDLVHRDRIGDVGPVRHLVGHAGQEGAGRPGVVAAALDEVGRFVVEAAADHHPLPERLERAQGRRQALQLPLLMSRVPVGHRHPVRHVEHAEALDRRGGGPALRRQGRDHAVEQREGHGGAETAQDGAAGQMGAGDERARTAAVGLRGE